MGTTRVISTKTLTTSYRRESARLETHTLNLARLITQEIAMMKYPKNPRQAFDRQSKLLKDAFIDKKE